MLLFSVSNDMIEFSVNAFVASFVPSRTLLPLGFLMVPKSSVISVSNDNIARSGSQELWCRDSKLRETSEGFDWMEGYTVG